MTADERFGAKWIEDPETGCHVWMAALVNGRYGTFDADGKTWLAHRFVYERANGSIPEGHEIHHVCANKRCVNPDHLEAVTPRGHPDAAPALNAAKTHCPQGHPYDEQNTYYDPSGWRQCRTCRDRRRRARMVGAHDRAA